MGKTVKVIPATRQKYTLKPIDTPSKRKTAGYARVSTDHEEQASSYEAQVSYYTEFIKSHEDWEFVGMYTDEGITATNTKHRDGFNRMIEDALAGRIDLIITKSVSRFARNTVDSLSTIRKLKEHGTEVYFEKENIWTLDAKGELLITIMSSLAQEESRSISENITWGMRKRCADGKVSVAYSTFMGYDRDFKINEEQAEGVRLIYRLFLSGYSCTAIARKLEELHIKSPAGKDRWYADSVQSILKNEKYRGDALLQKTYTSDFLTKKIVKNNGEVPQYYVENHHDGIIDGKTFRLVQMEFRRREKMGDCYSGRGNSPFSSKVVCGECGRYFGPRKWRSTAGGKKIIWQCNGRYGRGKNKCERRCFTPNMSEDRFRACFVKAVNTMISNRDEVIENMELLWKTVTDTSSLRAEYETTGRKLTAIVENEHNSIVWNAGHLQDQKEYERQYQETVGKYKKLKARYDELGDLIIKAEESGVAIRDLIGQFSKVDCCLTGFDETLWHSMVEYMTVYSMERIEVRFRGGYTVTVACEQ